jgi:hypothetical protein
MPWSGLVWSLDFSGGPKTRLVVWSGPRPEQGSDYEETRTVVWSGLRLVFVGPDRFVHGNGEVLLARDQDRSRKNALLGRKTD